MSHAIITIDDEVMVDGDYSEIITRPPEFLTDLFTKMQPDSAQKPKPYLIAAGATFAEALLRQANITIDVATGQDWWTMTVKER